MTNSRYLPTTTEEREGEKGGGGGGGGGGHIGANLLTRDIPGLPVGGDIIIM